jgi:hypothetical protein
MSNVRFVVDNLVDYFTLSSVNGSPNDNYIVSNVARSTRGQTFRSEDTLTDTEIKGTFSTNSSVSVMVIGRHNFSNSVYYRLYLYSDEAWTTTIYDSQNILVTSEEAVTDYWEWGEFYWGTINWGGSKYDNRIFYKQNIVLWLDQVYSNVKSFKIVFSAPVEGGGGEVPLYCNDFSIYCNNSDIYCNQTTYGEGATSSAGIDYYEVGRIILGHYIEPLYNLSYGHSISWAENTSQYRPSLGTLQSDIATTNRRFELSLKTIPESDRITIHKELQSVRLKKDLFISIFHENESEYKEEDYSGIVKIVTMPKFNEFIHSYYNTTYVLEES